MTFSFNRQGNLHLLFLSSQILLYHFCSESHLEELVEGPCTPVPHAYVTHMLDLAASQGIQRDQVHLV